MPKKTLVPKALFTTAFDEIATAWHKNLAAPSDAEGLVRRLLALEGLAVAEGLIVSPCVSFRVYGENVVLCRLIDVFGVTGVERLLEDDAIEFVLWRPLVGRWVKPMEGVFPLAAGNLNSAAHVDPEASVEMGLKGWSNQPFEKLQRIAKLAAKHTRLPDERLPHTAVAVLRAALESGRFEADGLGASTEWHRLPPQGIEHLARLGERIVEAGVALDAGYDFLDGKESWESLVKVSSSFQSASALHETAETVLRLEGLPNIPTLILKGALKSEDVVGIRSSDATKEFRAWLWSQPSPADAKAVGETYLAAMMPGAKTTDKGWFKTLRVSTISVATTVAGAGIGGAVAGVPGMVAGGALSLAASLADAFGLEKLLRGNNPRRFADEEIRPRVAELIARAPTQPPSGSDAPSSPIRPAPGPSQGTPPSGDGNRHDRRAKATTKRRKEKAARKSRRKTRQRG